MAHFIRLIVFRLSAVIAATALVLSSPMAQEASDKLKKEELQQILAPIALYPDDLLTNVLVGSTYPLEIVQAARWAKEPANKKLKGEELAKALKGKDWDPSIKSLIQFPDVLQRMSDELEWTQKLGDAFLAQQDDVMAEIQFLRKKADEAGHLESNKQQKVTKRPRSSSGGTGTTETAAYETVYIIEPASPEYIYVPVYQPSVVYGPWWYDDYPPYYWSYPGSSFVNGFFWGAGLAIAGSIWDWGDFDWDRGDIDIDVNRWNNINVDRPQIGDGKWQHNPQHRGPVPYKNKDVRQKFAKDKMPGTKDRAKGDRGDIDRAEIESKLKDRDGAQARDKAGDRAGEAKDRVGDRGPAKDKVGDRDGAPKAKDRAGDRPKGADKAAPRPADRAGDRPKSGDRAAQRPAPKQSPAFDVKKGSDVRKAANRGNASRKAMSGGGVNRGGGNRSRGGGGGGRSRGGRR